MATDGMHITGPEMQGHHEYNAQAPAMDSAEAHEGNLSSGLFPDHPKTGFYFDRKGDMCEPWELAVLESHSIGDSRHQTDAVTEEWQQTTVVKTGVTPGPRGGAYNSNLPNH